VNLKEELIKIVDERSVSDNQDDIAPLIKGQSLEPSQMPEIVVSVKNSDEVGKVIQLANDQKAPVTLSSSGEHNRGITPCKGGILLDLSKMKNIEAPDNRNRKVKVEAGVTWDEVGAVLKKDNLMINNPFLPRANSSVLTSVLERDPMLNAQFEFGERIMSLEMFWPTGELFRTGSASSVHYEKGSIASGCYPYGPGPLDPMRLLECGQGTMGVCTWTNLKTELLPEIDKAFLIPFDKLEDLAEALYAIQLKKLGKECVVLNSQNLATILENPGLKDSLPPWSILLVLPGGRMFPEEKIAYEEEALNEVQASVFSSSKLLEEIPGAGSTDILPGLLRNPWPADKTYWKNQPKGASQDLFFIAKLEKTPAFVEAVKKAADDNGYNSDDIGVYIQPMDFASGTHIEFNIFYDENNADEKATVEKVYTAAIEETLKLKAHYTRPYGKVMSKMVYDNASGYAGMLKKVKGIFDPNNVMKPGALCF
jgi:hypothetical protein